MKREFIETQKGCLAQEQTKLLRGAYERWQKSTDYELWHVYDNYSDNKEKAMDYCRELQFYLNGRGLKIISHNSMVFTVGFEFDHPETGELCFAYITRDYNRFMKVEA